MKILQIINDLSSGGAQKLIADFVPLMLDKGHEVEVLLLRSKGSIYIDDIEKKGIKVTCLSRDNLYSFLHIFRIRSLIKNGNFDSINVHLFPALYFVSISSILGIGKAVIYYTEHNTYNRRRDNDFFKILDKFIYKKYKRIVAITFDVKKALASHLNYNSDFITIINNGVDIDRFKNSTSIKFSELIEHHDNHDKIICMVGRFSEAKDQITLIKAISHLPKNVKLLLIGEGLLMDNCISLSKELDIQDRVHFLGLRKDIPKILKACDVGVLSSNWEGMPIFALEVFASGIPFIGSNVPGIRDLFLGENGTELVFNNKDFIGLSILIEELVKNKTSRVRNIEICQRIVSEFSLEKMTDSYLKLYKGLI